MYLLSLYQIKRNVNFMEMTISIETNKKFFRSYFGLKKLVVICLPRLFSSQNIKTDCFVLEGFKIFKMKLILEKISFIVNG